jgi:hypothetical protein
MPAPERTYTDQTPNIMQSLINMGGTRTTGTSSVSVDPAALTALQQVLASQMQGTTPEGAAALLQAIFSEGMNKVPGLATTYGQAVGARTRGNTPFQLALQDLMMQLTREGAKQVQTNQANASTTAGRMAEATRSESRSSTTSPRANMMQLLPFVMANAGKLKKGGSELLEMFKGFSGGNGMGATSDLTGGFAGANVLGENGYNFQPTLDFGSSFSGDSSGFDFGSMETVSPSFDFSGGGADPSFDFAGFQDAFGDFDLAFAKGGHVKVPGVKGYAAGGQVTGVGGNTSAVNGRPVRGVTYNDTPQPVDLLRALILEQVGSTTASNGKPATAQRRGQEKMEDGDTGESSPESGQHDGQIGTVSENQAAIAGFVSGLAGMTLGPIGGLAANAAFGLMGQPVTTMNPMTQAFNAVVNTIAHGNPAGEAAPGFGIADEGVTGMSVMGANGPMSVGTGPNSIGMNAFSSDALAAMMGEAPGVSGSSSTGGTDGGGDAAAAGVGGGGFKQGGNVQGPGTETSDSIMARLSDNEYVLNANAVDALGVDFLDMINHIMFPAGSNKKAMSNGR